MVLLAVSTCFGFDCLTGILVSISLLSSSIWVLIVSLSDLMLTVRRHTAPGWKVCLTLNWKLGGQPWTTSPKPS